MSVFAVVFNQIFSADACYQKFKILLVNFLVSRKNNYLFTGEREIMFRNVRAVFAVETRKRRVNDNRQFDVGTFPQAPEKRNRIDLFFAR